MSVPCTRELLRSRERGRASGGEVQDRVIMLMLEATSVLASPHFLRAFLL